MKANKEHRALALKDFQDRDFENVLKRPAFCPKKHHEKEELKFFCQDCGVAICNTCVVTLHDGHVKITLEEAADERKLQVKSVLESQKQKVLPQRNKIAVLEESCIRIQEQAATVKRDAKKFADMMTTLIEAKKKQIFKIVEFQKEKSLEDIIKHKSEIDHQVKLREKSIEETETLLTLGTTAEIVQLDIKSLNTILPEEVSQTTYNKVNCDLEVLRQLVFSENEALMDKINTEGIGSFKNVLSKTKAHQSSVQGKGLKEATVELEAEFVLTTRNSEGQQRYQEHDYVTLRIKNHEGHDCATKKQVQDNKDGTYKICYFPKETGECQASVKVNGEHVRGSPFAIQVKTRRQLRPVSSFGQKGAPVGMFDGPWGVAVNHRDEIAVTDSDNHRVQVFSSDGTYLRSFGREGDKPGDLNRPCGITFDKNGNIIVVDSFNHRVQMFSEHGEYRNHFGGLGTLDHQLIYPRGLSLDMDGNFIVADCYNLLVKIFSPSGKFLRKIGGHGILSFPLQCVQHDKYLLISECDENCVKVFDINGNFLYTFGKEGVGDGNFHDLRCLPVTKAGQLLVCDRNNHRIQIFELSGKFLGKFGTYGGEIGQFKGPISSAVLSNGRIVVTDKENNRVQILE